MKVDATFKLLQAEIRSFFAFYCAFFTMFDLKNGLCIVNDFFFFLKQKLWKLFVII